MKDGKVFLYDADGNTLSGESILAFDYTWDVFKRLKSVVTTESTESTEIVFSYDSQGRRTSKTVDIGNDGVIEKTVAYVYDGWNCVESTTTENDVASVKSYVWGIDLSGSTQGAGGVGGLLTETNDTGTYTACSDANGNVTAYVSADGSKVAEYVYTPFGRLESADGDMVDAFVYRYSTKPIDSETGLYYFGYRYYDAELGRWISQDPIGEAGGWNLYGYVGNSPINKVDYLGLSISDWIAGWFNAGCCKGTGYNKKTHTCCNGKIFKKTDTREIRVFATQKDGSFLIQHAWLEWNGLSAGYYPKGGNYYVYVNAYIMHPEDSGYTSLPVKSPPIIFGSGGYKYILKEEIIKPSEYDVDVFYDNVSKIVNKDKAAPPGYSASVSNCEVWASSVILRAQEESRCKK